ncbi:MAG: serine/threonine protein kinase [Kastovskya adunca ATA6-11-RM4]|jgi:serine/threonine protein kinase|nr:serine/threonine protein kinase [Kastovskya adunca ATA6-11-RM4]
MSNFPDLSSHGFKVVKELGHNRVGGRVTYLALNRVNRQPIVIKQFQFAKGNATWSGYDAYEQEIHILQGLNHPGIPRYLQSFQTADGFCMVQEYKKAPNLAVPRSFDADEIKQIAIALLEILIYLQNRIPSVSHRDLKPENILVDENINVFLVDFGMARLGEGEVAMSSVAKGTLGFIAPEQLFNRQITEASDLYGLGVTLICLLTGTKSAEISELIDDDYRINFKHLVPKLSLRMLDWLEKMVELKPKDRFPNAAAALEALRAIYVIRVPEVRLSQPSLEFVAEKLGERLTQVVMINNPVPDTVLEGHFEVAPHLSDPPHTPDFHTWIAFGQPKFAENQVLCPITIDTGKLMAGRVYEREVLVHTNSQPATQVVKVKLQTAPIPVALKKLPLLSLGLLVCFAAAATWVETTAWAGIINKSGSMGVAIAVFVTGFVAMFGLAAAVTSGMISKLVAKVRSRFGIALKTLDAAIVAFFAGAAALFVAAFGAQFRAPDAAIAAFAAVDAVVFMAVFEGENITKSCLDRGFSKRLALGVSLLAAGLGISLGVGFKLGFSHPAVTAAVLGTSFPLTLMILYPPLARAKRISNYRRSQDHLIKP